MSVNWKYVVGVVTITGIAGVTAYSIYAYKKQQKAEEEAISVEEAQAEVEAQREAEEVIEEFRQFAEEADTYQAVVDDTQETVKKLEGLFGEIYGHNPVDGTVTTKNDNVYTVADYLNGVKADEDTINQIAKEARVKPEEVEEVINEEVEDESYPDPEEVETEPIDESEKPLNNKEEDEVLRHDPNSQEALQQFIRMELADWTIDDHSYLTLRRLFDFPFMPENDGDHDLMSKIIDYRAQFFGYDSKWTQSITFADVVLHFARLTEFNIGDDIPHWVDTFFQYNQLSHKLPSSKIDKLIKEMNSHVYHNERRETYGIFGLSHEAMTNAIKIAMQNIDASLTYEIEFNEFLKMVL